MSYLHSRPNYSDDSGCIQKISPQSANWKYVSFEVHKLAAGEKKVFSSTDNETCMVIVSGFADVKTDNESWTNIGERMSVFEKKAPYSVYTPPKDTLIVTANTELEVAICKAPAVGKYPTRLIKPQDCSYETRGNGTNQRHVCNILFANLEAEKLLVVEVITPDGNWSSYPPHKHDSDNLPQESSLEETYYHKLNPQQGFAFQRVYTDDRKIDETISVEHNSVVMVPEGYHPVGSPHGYELYYLNVMAGPTREWIFKNDPAHEWILNK
ncbi:5-deoxy-glucuronate isomerase [Pseudoalteromonas translucida KMM 520]|uniref:5-deoxy-glucuronate isomerase n=1 Tax=Pseudoalteromonas translucida KMM 520 TaxID=1315283 RepID=A0A0U2WIF3_9GAMM|nr:5-deoxy-glucuronate isomerase [Pseudoalteromonas translucida]ALS34823.1 5-deoxy-glucuronate isomerase [Pseudoalteromonas translucida KMM 520]